MLLAIDPGMCSPGVAMFSDARVLVAATRIKAPDSYAELDAGQRWLAVAGEIANWAIVYHVDAVVFEKPQWYPLKKSKVDPNSLVGIAGVAANVTGMLSGRNPITVKSPTPAEWIGQLSKECPVCKGRKTTKRADGKKGRGKPRVCAACSSSAWGTPRGRYIQKRLTPEELALCPDQNDAIDAVGLGLWALGRLVPVSVFSNGRDGR